MPAKWHAIPRYTITPFAHRLCGALMDNSTFILGIEIPSTDPVFLEIIAIHIPLGLACVIAGAIAMLSAKGRGRHSIVGGVYYWCLGALFVSATLR